MSKTIIITKWWNRKNILSMISITLPQSMSAGFMEYFALACSCFPRAAFSKWMSTMSNVLLLLLLPVLQMLVMLTTLLQDWVDSMLTFFWKYKFSQDYHGFHHWREWPVMSSYVINNRAMIDYFFVLITICASVCISLNHYMCFGLCTCD